MSGANEGRVAIVTGAASGIGRAAAERLAAEGASVVAVDLTADGLTWTADHDRVVTCVGSVAEEATNTAMVSAAVEAFGRLDAVVLNAGVAATARIESSAGMDRFDRAIDVNVRAVALGVRASLAELRRSDAPAICVTASVSGMRGDPGMWAYNASKGAVLNMVRSMAIDLGHEGIRVNAVCPGPTLTGMTAPMEDRLPELVEAMRNHVPLHRWGRPEELAAAISFLISPDASFITGVGLPVDGGVTAGTGQFSPPGSGAPAFGAN